MAKAQAGRVSRSLVVACAALCLASTDAEAQGRRDREAAVVSAEVTFSLGVEAERQIRAFYADRPARGVEALPPGIRRNLARGKPLPPGIAKRVAPRELVSAVTLPRGYEIVEVGVDVFIVEAATAIVRDILTDIIR